MADDTGRPSSSATTSNSLTAPAPAPAPPPPTAATPTPPVTAAAPPTGRAKASTAAAQNMAAARKMESSSGREYKYFTEISQMMFVFGEVQDPMPETVNLVEDIVRSQIIELVRAARFPLNRSYI